VNRRWGFATYQTPALYRQKRMLHSRRTIGICRFGYLAAAFLASRCRPLPFLASEYLILPGLTGYPIWTISLGGLGAAASLAVNSLSEKNYLLT
jgi:hypothetical protein